MTLITKSEELMAVSVRQGVELAAIEAKVLLGYLEGHDYSLMMDDEFHLALHDNQDGENADNDQPYTIRDCIDFCQEMNSELLLEEAEKEGGDPDYFSELQKDELILGHDDGTRKGSASAPDQHLRCGHRRIPEEGRTRRSRKLGRSQDACQRGMGQRNLRLDRR